MVAENEPGLDLSGSGDIEFGRLSNETLKKLHRFVYASTSSIAMISKVVRHPENRFTKTPDGIVAVAIAKKPTMLDINDVLVKLFDSYWFTSNRNMEIGSITQSAFNNFIKIEFPSVVGQPKSSLIISRDMWMSLLTIMGYFTRSTANSKELTSKVTNNTENSGRSNCVMKKPATFDVNALVKLFNSEWFNLNANAFDNSIKIGLPSIIGQPKTSLIISQDRWMSLLTIMGNFTRPFQPIEHGMNEFDSMVLRFSGDWFEDSRENNLSSQFEKLSINQGNVYDYKYIDIDLDDGNISDTESNIDTDDYTSESEDWDHRPLSPTSLGIALYDLYNH